MVEERCGFEKKSIALQDGRELIYYTFTVSQPASGGKDGESETGEGAGKEEEGRV
jgi:hypothetical protein